MMERYKELLSYIKVIEVSCHTRQCFLECKMLRFIFDRVISAIPGKRVCMTAPPSLCLNA